MDSIKNILVLIILLVSYTSCSQKKQDFTIFYSAGRYNEIAQEKLLENKNFKRYILFLNLHIDPKKKGVVDKEVFLRNIERVFPNKFDSILLVLDLENKLFKDLYSFDKRSTEFKNASNEFIWMLKTVKEMRPNVKVGIYGLPFRGYYKHSFAQNTKKLDKVLKHADILFPSLYTMYTNKQVGFARNKKYLEDNLKCALWYGKRLNKKVVPFVWSMVHPSNSTDAYKLVDNKEIASNLQIIKNYSYKGLKVNGIAWWDPDSYTFTKWYNKAYNKNLEVSKQTQSEIILEVFKNYISNE